MNFVISDVKTRRKAYPDRNDPSVQARLLTVAQYHNLARRIIGQFAPANSKMAMLNSEDAIDFVAHHIMIGDWGYEDDKSKISSYRGYCGKQAIKSYLAKLTDQRTVKSKNSKGETIERCVLSNMLDHQPSPDTDQELYEIIADSQSSQPLERLMNSEQFENNKHLINTVFNCLSETQRQCIIMHYFQKMNMEAIGEQLDLTREGVRRSIIHGIKRIQKFIGSQSK